MNKNPHLFPILLIITITVILGVWLSKTGSFRKIVDDETIVSKNGLKVYEIDTGYCQLSLKAYSPNHGHFDLYILKSEDFERLKISIKNNHEYPYANCVMKSENITNYESNNINLGVGKYFIIIDNSRYGKAWELDDISIDVSLKERPLT